MCWGCLVAIYRSDQVASMLFKKAPVAFTRVSDSSVYPKRLASLAVQVEEVPLDGDSAGGYSVGTLDKPTTRLSQYARGKTGSMNPFTPGGEVLYI